MSRHARRLPWWRRGRVMGPVLVAGVTTAIVGAGVLGFSPVSASAPTATTAAAGPGPTVRSAPASADPSPSVTPVPPVMITAAVAHSVVDLPREDLDVAVLSTPSSPADRARSLAGWSRAPHSASPIVWRSHAWRLIQSASVQIPYVTGNTVSRSLVELEARNSGVSFWVLDARAPAGAGSSSVWRTSLASIESKLASELSETGTPVLFLGNRTRPVAGSGLRFAASVVSGGLVRATGTLS